MSHSLRDKDPPQAETRKGLLSGLVEGIRNRRDRSLAADLIDNAMAGGRPEDLQAALEKFSSLEKGSREKLLLRLQARLESTTSFPFESETKVQIITVAGEFFASTERDLVRDKEGNLVIPYGRAVSIFKSVLQDNNLYDPKNPSHREAKLACAKALWELDVGSKGFWAERLSDQATSGYTVMKLLSEQYVGWSILRENFKQVAPMIAKSKSEKAPDFFVAVAKDADRETLKAAIAASVHLEKMPREFVAKARELFRSSDPDLNEMKQSFARSVWKRRAAGMDFWRERLLDPATIDYTLVTLLSDTKDGWILLKEQLTKVAIIAALCKSDKKADFFTNMLLDQDPQVLRAALAGSLYLEKIPPEFFDIARDISQLGNGLDFDSFVFVEATHFKSMLVFGDDRQFDGARGLISLYQQGAGHLAPLLHSVGREMVDVLVEPAGLDESEQQRQRNAAGETLALLAMAGIRVPGVQIDIHKEG